MSFYVIYIVHYDLSMNILEQMKPITFLGS